MYKIPANTVFLGKNLIFMPECHSTNSYALNLCQGSASVAEGTVVITSHQTAGRGQRGNRWEVEPGCNLTFSIVLNTGFLSIQDQFYLNIFSALAILDYLSGKGCAEVAIKWPNDVLVGAGKICGILIENQLSGNSLTKSVIGIGLNINQRHFDVAHATSLGLQQDQGYHLPDELETLLSFLEARYLQLRGGDQAGLMRDYLRFLYGLNEPRTFRAGGTDFEGLISGVDPLGRLRVRVGPEEKVFAIKEISFVQ